MTADDPERFYAGVVANLAKLARTLADTDPYNSVNGDEALRNFADHLDGIVASVGVDQS